VIRSAEGKSGTHFESVSDPLSPLLLSEPGHDDGGEALGDRSDREPRVETVGDGELVIRHAVWLGEDHVVSFGDQDDSAEGVVSHVGLQVAIDPRLEGAARSGAGRARGDEGD
jgi:hypothetical protein